MAQDISASGNDNATSETTKVFLSYSRKDREFVGRLAEALESQQGIQVFQDTEDILPTEEWRQRLEGLIGEADTIVFCLSPDSAASDVCAWEVEVAERLNKRIAPIVIRDVDGQVPGGLSKLNYIFFTERDDFQKALSNLVTAVNTDINWIREHTRIGELTRRWVVNGERKDHLLRGKDIDDAEKWSSYRPSNAPELTADMVRFVEGSRSYATALTRRIRTIAASVTMILAGVVAGFMTWKTWLPMTDVAIYKVLNQMSGEKTPSTSFAECSFCPEMVVIPAGKFMMGSPDGEGDDDERPQHEVTIGRPFAVSRFEITFDEWDACVTYGGCAERATDSGWGRQSRPVSSVSWNDAQEFVTWLSKLTGHEYRLLTEPEWEYAARAGTTTRYSWGDEIGKGNANCNGCGSEWDGKQTAPVGSFKPNAFGIYDMYGNVFEWVEDCYIDSYKDAPTDGTARTSDGCSSRVLRGGSWGHFPGNFRSAIRDRTRPGDRVDYIGFRLARTLNP